MDLSHSQRASSVESPAAAGTDQHGSIVGRGARDSARLTRKWFHSLDETAQSGQGAAYVFVMASMCEVLKTFDLPVVFPEVTALQTAVRGTSEDYLSQAEDLGFSSDVCGYLKADIAMHHRGAEHPMGKIPKPLLVVMTNACNTYFKWAEIWGRMYGAPLTTIDIPNERAAHSLSARGSDDFEFEHAYVVKQIKELIAECERVTGKKFDIDKFRQHLAYSNVIGHYWRKMLHLNASNPAVFNALTDGLAYLGMVNCYRSTPEGAEYFKNLYEELEFCSRHGIGPTIRRDGKEVPIEQKFRLGFLGVPCYSMFRGFPELFSDWGGIFVTSGYMMFASGGIHFDHEYEMKDPIESFAEGLLLQVRDLQSGLFFELPNVESKLSPFKLDGIVYHGVKSCRTASSGLVDRRFHAAESLGLPSLLLESELVDPRVVSKAQMKNRVDAFFEGLISRQQQEVIAAR